MTRGTAQDVEPLDVVPVPIVKPWFGPEEAAAAAGAVESGWVAQGPQVEAFERAVAARVGAPYGVAVSSCTTGLHLCLVVAGVGPGDEVVLPSLSFIATANVVRYVGATPVFADVDPTTHNLTADTIEPLLGSATRAVIVVHQSGLPADVDDIHRLCDPLGITVVEDAACAIGSTYRGRPVGGDCDLAAFSFHPRKVLVTGEGGMVTTRRADWSRRLCRLREHGMSVNQLERHRSRGPVLESYLETGFNYRMTDIQAAIGLVQLSKLDRMVARRRRLAARYQQLLADLPGVQVAADPPYGLTNYQSFWLVLPEDFAVSRNELLRRMYERQIHPRRGIMAAHLEPAYADVAAMPLPVTERVTRQSLLLPLFHEMSEAQQDRVVAAIRSAAAGGAG